MKQWKYYSLLIVIAIIIAIINNLQTAPESKTTWFGGQSVMEKPKD